MLAAFLIELARTPFAWGACDCSLMIADWWRANHGVDPAAHLRGTYSTEAECNALLEREGGKLRLVARLARSVGAKPTKDIRPGVFGVARHGQDHIPGIVAPDGKWAGKSPSGLVVFIPHRIVAAWNI